MDIFLDPEKVLDQLDLSKNMVAAEFGCGSGGFAIPLAKKLQDGLVYGLDIQETPLNVLKSRAHSQKIFNVKVIRCDLEKPRGSTLADSSLDLVLISNVLFQAESKAAIITEAKRVLRQNGKLVIVDWLPTAPQSIEGRISPEEAKKTAADAGLILEKEFEAGRYHWGVVFKRP